MAKSSLRDSILHSHLAEWLASALDVPCPDPDQRRRGRLLNVLIWALLLGSIVAALVKTFSSPQGFLQFSLSHLTPSALVLALLLVILGLNRRGRVRLASVLYLGVFVAAVSFMFRIQDLDRIMVLYIVPTMGASFLLIPPSSFALATLSILGYSVAYWATPAGVPYNYVSCIGLYLAALVAWLAAANLENALREIRQRADQLDRWVLDRTRDLAEALAREHSEASQTQAILRSIADGVIVFDQNGQAIVANPAVCALLECGESDLLGHDINAVMALAPLGTAGQAVGNDDQAIIRSLVGDGGPAHAGLKIAWGNRTVAIHLAPVNLPFVKEHGTLVVLRDVTREAQVDRMKSEFVSIVSHELRTPMTSIKGYVDLLAMGMLGAVSEQQREYLHIVKTNADRLSEMVKELLDLSQIEAGKVQMHYQAVSLPCVVHEVKLMLQKDFDDRGIRLQLDVPDALPAVLCDPGRLTQIVTNLLSNALKYTFQGHVSVTARVVGRYVQVDIADTGIGMSEEDQAKLFTRFFRASTARVREISGTGLGLSITRSLIEMQGGRIWVKSAVDQGSAFSFTIPVLPEPLAHMAPPVDSER
jgi:signal transduction histidine kinase